MAETRSGAARVVVATAAALGCFAGNSLLCRLALADGQIDATSFTVVRLASGAAALALLAARRPRDARPAAAKWLSAGLLFAYAAPFSFAYLRLGAAMGALILFGLVQATMLGWGVARGERPSATGWLGIAAAVSGLLLLTLPGRSAPDPWGAAAMALAGIAWGAYSLRGRAMPADPLVVTAASFSRSLPLGAALAAVAMPRFGAHATARGMVLAAASGALTSGVGYSIWYGALPHLTAVRAAIVQLLVPISRRAARWPGSAKTCRCASRSAARRSSAAWRSPSAIARADAALACAQPARPNRWSVPGRK